MKFGEKGFEDEKSGMNRSWGGDEASSSAKPWSSSMIDFFVWEEEERRRRRDEDYELLFKKSKRTTMFEQLQGLEPKDAHGTFKPLNLHEAAGVSDSFIPLSKEMSKDTKDFNVKKAVRAVPEPRLPNAWDERYSVGGRRVCPGGSCCR